MWKQGREVQLRQLLQRTIDKHIQHSSSSGMESKYTWIWEGLLRRSRASQPACPSRPASRLCKSLALAALLLAHVPAQALAHAQEPVMGGIQRAHLWAGNRGTCGSGGQVEKHLGAAAVEAFHSMPGASGFQLAKPGAV